MRKETLENRATEWSAFLDSSIVNPLRRRTALKKKKRKEKKIQTHQRAPTEQKPYPQPGIKSKVAMKRSVAARRSRRSLADHAGCAPDTVRPMEKEKNTPGSGASELFAKGKKAQGQKRRASAKGKRNCSSRIASFQDGTGVLKKKVTALLMPIVNCEKLVDHDQN